MIDPLNTVRGKKLEAILRDVCAQRLDVEIFLKGDDQKYNTKIHDVNFKQQKLQIHAFEQGEVDRRILPGVIIGGRFTLEKLPYRFKTKCSNTSMGIHYHLLDIPKTIEAIQRRAHFRIKPPRLSSVLSSVCFDEDGPFKKADTQDISVGGVKLYFKNLELVPENGTEVCIQLKFSTNQKFQHMASIVHSRTDPGSKLRKTIALKFEQVPAGDELVLGRIIMDWQRLSRRSKLDK